MASLAALMRDARGCVRCAALLPLGPRPVFQLHAAARILIAAQAPGRVVHDTGIPFNDASGKRLRSWLGLTCDVFHNAKRVAILPLFSAAAPSPRNNGWLAHNPWFERDLLPALQARVAQALAEP
jgi:uracil-DNA glycosylase